MAGWTFAGCLGGDEPLPPDEALAQATQRINAILDEEKAFPREAIAPAAQETPADISTVSFWFCAHPIIAPAFGLPSNIAAYNNVHVGTLDAQFIGEWPYAIQKLTVSLAADDVPDVALVKRAWLGRLAESGRIAALDSFLPSSLVGDLEPPVRKALSINGRLYAFPCDAFCSVLYYNKSLVNAPPSTWQELQEAAASIAFPEGSSSDARYAIGHLPFLELLWSAGGGVCEGGKCELNGPEAHETLDFILSLRDEGLLNPRTQGYPEQAFQLYLSGRVAMTAASSEFAVEAANAAFPTSMAPIPGKTGPASLFSDNALVVFRKHAEARRAAIVELFEFISGPEVLGTNAVELGSVPVRKSVAAQIAAPDGLKNAFDCARGTPLIGPWASIEFEMDQYLGLAYRWKAVSSELRE